MVTLELRPGGGGATHTARQELSIPDRGNSRCKGPVVGLCSDISQTARRQCGWNRSRARIRMSLQVTLLIWNLSLILKAITEPPQVSGAGGLRSDVQPDLQVTL